MLRNHNRITRHGVTLVELLVALAVVAVLSTAVAIMLSGAGRIHQFVNNETDAMSQVENAYRRMMHNIRTSSATPTYTTTTVSGTTYYTLSVRSQPDSSGTGSVATSGSVITYKIATTGTNIGALVETDERYGESVLLQANMVVANQSFVAVATTGGAPTQVTISIVAYPGSQYQVKRTAIIACRNF